MPREIFIAALSPSAECIEQEWQLESHEPLPPTARELLLKHIGVDDLSKVWQITSIGTIDPENRTSDGIVVEEEESGHLIYISINVVR